MQWDRHGQEQRVHLRRLDRVNQAGRFMLDEDGRAEHITIPFAEMFQDAT